MPIISGLGYDVKEQLRELCKHKRITQIDWVKQHLENDLKELAKEGIDVGALSPLPTQDKT